MSNFISNDITDTPNLFTYSLSIIPVLESTPSSAPTPVTPIVVDSLPRRSARISKPLAYLQAYKCKASTKYPIANYISSHKLSPSYYHFGNSISVLKEPMFYHQAIGDPNWDVAMVAKFQALELNNTWSLVLLPPNKRVVGWKRVFKIKYKSDGSVETYKARLVAKGYT